MKFYMLVSILLMFLSFQLVITFKVGNNQDNYKENADELFHGEDKIEADTAFFSLCDNCVHCKDCDKCDDMARCRQDWGSKCDNCKYCKFCGLCHVFC